MFEEIYGLFTNTIPMTEEEVIVWNVYESTEGMVLLLNVDRLEQCAASIMYSYSASSAEVPFRFNALESI